MIWSVTQLGAQHQQKQVTPSQFIFFLNSSQRTHTNCTWSTWYQKTLSIFSISQLLLLLGRLTIFPAGHRKVILEINPLAIFQMHCQTEPADANFHRCIDREAGPLKQLVPYTLKGLWMYGHHGKNWELQHAADKHKTQKTRHKRWLNFPTLSLPKRAPDGIGPPPQGTNQPHFLRVKANKKSPTGKALQSTRWNEGGRCLPGYGT